MVASVDARDASPRWRAPAAFAAVLLASAGTRLLHDGLDASLDGLRLTGTWLASVALSVVAARLARRQPHRGAVAARLLIVSAAAVAVPSVIALLQAPASGTSVAALTHAFLTQRLSPLFADVNAAGSFFTLFAAAAVWMWAAARPHGWWAAPALLLLLALWITGSRTALAGLFVVLPAVWIVVRRPGRRALALAAVSALALVAAVVFAPPTRVPQASSSYALRVRVDMAKVALAIAARHPLLGVGLGNFQTASVAFIPPDVVAYFPPAAVGENAHNNFLQVLAELGGPGLAAFIWLLASPLRGGWRAVRAGQGAPELAGLAAGIAAFLLTCLTGHPLLSEPVTLAFFLTLGLLSGLAGGHSIPVTHRRGG